MSSQTLRILIAGALFVHGVGHTLGFWMPARSWLLPDVPEPTLKVLSSVLWLLAAIGFVAACLGFLGILIPTQWWRTLAVGTAVISLLGLIIFFGNWPAFNTTGAIGMNLAILVALLWLHWPPEALTIQ
jgi:hypothetical protein